MTQTEEIREYLDTHPDGITPLDALDLFGCFRLGARIWDIKHGVGCEVMEIETVNETKNGKTYARYKKFRHGPNDPIAPALAPYANKIAASVGKIPTINLLPPQQSLGL